MKNHEIDLPRGAEVERGALLVAFVALNTDAAIVWPPGWEVERRITKRRKRRPARFRRSLKRGRLIRDNTVIEVAYRVTDGTEPRSIFVSTPTGVESVRKMFAYTNDRHLLVGSTGLR